jgi:hypothetical protein
MRASPVGQALETSSGEALGGIAPRPLLEVLGHSSD